jgi:hypothetical protein
MYELVVFLHIAGVFGFLLSHGTAASMLFRLRTERNPERIRTLLDESTASLNIMYPSLGLLLLAGIVAGFMGSWWGRAWIWAALGLLIAIIIAMSFLGSLWYAKVRKAVGLPYFENFKQHDEIPAASAEEIAAVLNGSRPALIAAIGIIGLGLILWLMIFKPF